MDTNPENTDNVTTITTAQPDGPDLALLTALLAELKDSLTRCTEWRSRMDLADDTRWCRWRGQSPDGRKHREVEGDPDPFPWEDASDARIRLAEQYIREADMVCSAAYKRGRWKLSGTEGRNDPQAGKLTVALRWQVQQNMARETERQRKLAVTWRHMYGLSLTHLQWEREEGIALQRVDLLDLAKLMGLQAQVALAGQLGISLPANLEPDEDADPDAPTPVEKLELQVRLAAENPPAPAMAGQPAVSLVPLAAALAMLVNPDAEEELIAELAELFPLATESRLEKAATELRETGAAQLPQAYTRLNRPRRRALKPFVDVFFPVNTMDIQEAEWVAVREWLPLAKLEARAKEEGWSDEFLAKVKLTEGKNSTVAMERLRKTTEKFKEVSAQGDTVATYKGQYELFYFYYWANDADGIRTIYRTLLSNQASMMPNGGTNPNDKPETVYGTHDLCDYEHGKMPFETHQMVPDSPTLLENVGIPWYLFTYQNEIKAQRDYQIDAASISILPSRIRHIRDMGTPDDNGPGGVRYESVVGSARYDQPPNSRMDISVAVENAVRRDANRLVGSPDAENPPPLVELHKQDLIDAYLAEEVECHTQVLQLMQQYMDDTTVTLVTGAHPRPFPLTRAEIQGQFFMRFIFAAWELDVDQVQTRLEALQQLLLSPANALMDQTAILTEYLGLLDPSWPDEFILSPQSSSQNEVNDEMKNIALIMTGQEPPMQEKGQNFGLRLKVMQTTRAKSPVVQTELSTSDAIAKVWMTREKQLEFQVQQLQNAQIGRVGAAPVLGEPLAPAGGMPDGGGV